MNLIFIGTSEFAVPSLENLTKSDYKIKAVITAPDKPQGRKKETIPSPVKQKAEELQLKTLQPKDIKEIKEEIFEISPDLIIVAAYGQIIPKEIIEYPKLGSLNIHPSLLPKYRGPSPIQSAILKGEKEIGVTIIKMDEKMDHGPILSQEKIKIKTNQYYPEIQEKLSEEAASLLNLTISRYLKKEITPRPQNDSKATYTKILTRQDGEINWQKEAQEIERKVKAFYPWPGTWVYFKNKRVKIIKAKAITEERDGTVKTGKDYLLLEKVQPDGKKPMSGADFLRGLNK